MAGEDMGSTALREHKRALEDFYKKHLEVGFWQEKYGPHLGLFVDRMVRRNTTIMAHLPLQMGLALDLGCGLGDLLPPLAARARYAVGCDLAENHLRPAHRNLRELMNVGLVLAPVETLPFRDGHFDCVLLADVIEHVADPDQCLAEVFRVLRSGGRLILTTPDKWTDLAFAVGENIVCAPFRVFGWTKRALRAAGLWPTRRPPRPPIVERNLSRADLRRRVARAGFALRVYQRIEFYPGSESGGAFAKFLKLTGRIPGLRQSVVEPMLRPLFRGIEALGWFNLRQFLVAERPEKAAPGGS